MTLSVQVDDEDRASRLLELQSRVRTATGESPEIEGDIALLLEGWTYEKMKGDRQPYWRKPGALEFYMRSPGGPPPYTSSIDAALGLVARVLPGWNYQIMQQRGDHTPFFLARIATVTDDDVTGFDAVNDHGAPLAILDALLSALIAQSEASLRAVPTKPES